MTTTIAIRLTDTWSRDLWRPTPCGGHLPYLYLHQNVVDDPGTWVEGLWHNPAGGYPLDSLALPLLWQGKVVPMGASAATQALAQTENLIGESALALVCSAEHHRPAKTVFEWWLEVCTSAGATAHFQPEVKVTKRNLHSVETRMRIIAAACVQAGVASEVVTQSG